MELEKLMKSLQQPREYLIKEKKKPTRILIIKLCDVLAYPDSAVALKTTSYIHGIGASNIREQNGILKEFWLFVLTCLMII